MLRSFGKVVAVLDVFTPDAPEWALGELSRRVRMPKPTVHHILATLLKAGWVVQTPDTRRYRLGVRLWEKGWLAINQLGLREQARPHVEALADASRETVHLAILDAVDPGYVVYIDKIESEHPVRAYSVIGGRAPSYCVATGKVILAFDPAALRRLLARRLRAHTELTITAPKQLTRELALTRERGFSVNRGEYRADVVGAAAPIRDHEGRVFAAVGISGPSYRLSLEAIRKLARTVVTAGEKISAQLGFIDTSAGPSRPRRAASGRA